jgi:hypothetical protein
MSMMSSPSQDNGVSISAINATHVSATHNVSRGFDLSNLLDDDEIEDDEELPSAPRIVDLELTMKSEAAARTAAMRKSSPGGAQAGAGAGAGAGSANQTRNTPSQDWLFN